MTGKPWKFVLFFFVCLVIALLINLPIQHVLTRVNLPGSIRLAGADGTVFRGKAEQVVVERFSLHNVEYRFLPSCIPLLKVCYRVDYRQGTAQIAYDWLNGDTEVSGARLEYPVSEIAQYIPNLLVQPSGNLELIVDEMEIVGNRPAALSGRLIGRDLGIDDGGTSVEIGDYELAFVGDTGQYRFKLNDIDGDLDVDGEGEIGADGQYLVDIRIVVADSIDSRLRSVLDLAAKQVSYNNYRIDRRGQIPPRIRTQIFN